MPESKEEKKEAPIAPKKEEKKVEKENGKEVINIYHSLFTHIVTRSLSLTPTYIIFKRLKRLLYICIHIYILCIYKCIDTHTHIHIYIHTYIYMISPPISHIHFSLLNSIYIYTYIYIHTYIYIYI